ncbi:MAG: hypothetical protein V4663_05095 [Bacteroidota bacterium]
MRVALWMSFLVLLNFVGSTVRSQQDIYRINIEKIVKGKSVRSIQTGFKAKGIRGIITALHGVAGNVNITVQRYKGETFQNVRILSWDVINDICVLSSPALDGLPLQEGFELRKDVKPAELKGKKVSVQGFQMAVEGKQNINLELDNETPIVPLQSYVPANLVKALGTRNSPGVLQEVLALNGRMLPGNSGSPILLGNQVIGMGDGGLNGGYINYGWAMLWDEKIKLKPFSENELYKKLAQSNDGLFASQGELPEGTTVEDFISDNKIKQDIAFVILDKGNKPMSSLSNDIAAFYRKQGLKVSTSLFKQRLFASDYLDEILNAESQVFETLQLPNFTDLIAIGRYTEEIGKGTWTNYVCRVKLEVIVISCLTQTVVNSFQVNEIAAPHDYQDGARSLAMKKLLTYYQEHYQNLQ